MNIYIHIHWQFKFRSNAVTITKSEKKYGKSISNLTRKQKTSSSSARFIETRWFLFFFFSFLHDVEQRIGALSPPTDVECGSWYLLNLKKGGANWILKRASCMLSLLSTLAPWILWRCLKQLYLDICIRQFQRATKLLYKLRIPESFTSRLLIHAHIWLDNVSKTICVWLAVAMFESPAVWNG